MSEYTLADAIKAVEKKVGPGVVRTMSDSAIPTETISTGSLLLDKATGIGGIPRGLITEMFGNESGGKTTIALQTIANAQKDGIACFFIDTENSLDLEYAKALGVSDDPKLFAFAQPDSGEDALEIAREMIRSGAVGLVVVDSVAAMSPRAELEGGISDATIGSQARLMGKSMRMLAGEVRKNKVALLMVNQVREKIGVLFGNPETTPGGRALKFWASLRIRINQSKKIGKAGEETGQSVIATVVKNKRALPFRKCTFNIVFGEGVSVCHEMVDIGTEIGLWERKGSFYKFGSESIQGADNMADYLKDLKDTDPEAFDKYYQKCRYHADVLHIDDDTEVKIEDEE